ncbi:MAG: acyclic terpene utilization AtuA family protein [Pseudomonadota bacterium]
MKGERLRIGGASGYWGDSPMAVPQFLKNADLDYIVFDYLAEITMSIMARARAKDPEAGYARDFVTTALAPHLDEIARQGVKIVSNAGGVNPRACAEALRERIKNKGLSLKVAVVLGDDLTDRAGELEAREMFSGAPFPDPAKVASVNAYLGAFPIARALDAGADIVITGRCVDSAVTLGACIHEFGWGPQDLDRLAGGTLAGHILECGPQATGGNFTDWEEVADSIDRIGYPVAEVEPSGAFEVTKPEGTGGKVSVGTVAEQMLYEIGDPQAYLCPDVACDFSQVSFAQTGRDRVRVEGAKGLPAPASYKVSATWFDGWRGGSLHTFYGFDAEGRARTFARAAFSRAEAGLRASNLGEFTETSVEVLGAESQFGAARVIEAPREVVVKIAAKHPEQAGIATLIRAATGVGLAAPSGLSGFQGGRPKPSPVVRLFSFLMPKRDVPVSVEIDGRAIDIETPSGPAFDPAAIARPAPPPLPGEGAATEVPLVRLAWGRSGDKGDKANVGIIARKPEYLPWIWAALDEETVARTFAHFLQGKVERFLLPGSNAVNFLLHDVLGGGGVASLRNDPQGKGYAQILLAHPIPVSAEMAERVA